MIDISKISTKEPPYLLFKECYNLAIKKNQQSVEAIAISSFDMETNDLESRYVNLKYIKNDEWIFFSNYDSLKSQNFENLNKIAALFYWNSINVQVRVKANIFKTSKEFSDYHYNKRSDKKNALAHSSRQSESIESYEAVVKNYHDFYANKELLKNRPENWGGFYFIPYYFEFWEGHESRLNKREVYKKNNNHWDHFILQP